MGSQRAGHDLVTERQQQCASKVLSKRELLLTTRIPGWNVAVRTHVEMDSWQHPGICPLHGHSISIPAWVSRRSWPWAPTGGKLLSWVKDTCSFLLFPDFPEAEPTHEHAPAPSRQSPCSRPGKGELCCRGASRGTHRRLTQLTLLLFSLWVMSDCLGIPWAVDCQAPLSMELSKQEHWSRLPFPSLGDLPHPGIEPMSPTLTGRFSTTEPPGKPPITAQGETLKDSPTGFLGITIRTAVQERTRWIYFFPRGWYQPWCHPRPDGRGTPLDWWLLSVLEIEAGSPARLHSLPGSWGGSAMWKDSVLIHLLVALGLGCGTWDL